MEKPLDSDVGLMARNEIFPHEKMKIRIRQMSPGDFDAVLSFWVGIETLGMSGADTEKNLVEYLRRNPRLCFIALDGDEIIGAILGGHDGRRGTLYHLAVTAKYRKMGVGHLLAEKSLRGLKKRGIQKCHVFVFPQNSKGLQFWKALGWKERTDLVMLSYDLTEGEREKKT